MTDQQRGVCAERLADFKKGHPEFNEFVARWADLLMLQKEVKDELRFPDAQVFAWTEEEFIGGVPLATKLPAQLFMEPFRESSARMGNQLAAMFPPLGENISRLQKRLEDDAWCAQCLAAVVNGDAAALAAAASSVDISPEILLFYARAVYSPCAKALRPLLEEHPSVVLWRKRYCPICGSDPDLETLEIHADEADFVVSKSGQAWLHCPQCGLHWRFSRAVCPSCGTQENSKLTRYSLAENPQEFIYACDACNHYLPCIDMADRPAADSFADMDCASLSMVHLDAVAQAKGYKPLSPAAWALVQLFDH